MYTQNHLPIISKLNTLLQKRLNFIVNGIVSCDFI